MGRLRPWLDFALAQAPALYARVLRRRRQLNLEKLAFLAVVRRGDVVFDVGANHGYYTLLFSHLVGRGGQVHAFEPVPPTFAALSAHVERGRRFDNVTLNECALAAAAGELPLFVPDGDHGQASMARHAAGSWASAAQVHRHACRSETLDGYLAERGGAPPSFVKCDVEGAELRVLEGASETLRRRRPPLLHLEVNPDWTRSLGYEPSDLVRFLAPYGYSRFLLVDGRIRPLADPVRELAAFRGSANLVCGVSEAHGGRLDRLLAWAPAASPGPGAPPAAAAASGAACR